ncbi:MAG: hypothetical protein Q9222_006257 [Ikaeria aurantiellina]
MHHTKESPFREWFQAGLQVSSPNPKAISSISATANPTAVLKMTEDDVQDAAKCKKNISGVAAPPFPLEVLLQIVHYVQTHPSSQHGLWAMTMVSRSWYAAAIDSLYRKPSISGKNFNRFVQTICPSINAHIRKTSFSTMVKELDLSNLVHDSSRSLTSRILGRLKHGLEVFVAPQTSFGYDPDIMDSLGAEILMDYRINCLAALSKCQHLRRLDLSFISQSIALLSLLHSIHRLDQLHWLAVKCNCAVVDDLEPWLWPQNLRFLQLSGWVSIDGWPSSLSLPQSISSLAFQHCHSPKSNEILDLIKDVSPTLTALQLGPGLGYTNETTLVHWLEYLPKLLRLRISTSACTRWMTDFFVTAPAYKGGELHPLQRLELEFTDNQGSSILSINYTRVWNLIADGYLGCLRRFELRCPAHVWRPPRLREELEDINDFLCALAREDEESAVIKEKDAGVYVYKI